MKQKLFLYLFIIAPMCLLAQGGVSGSITSAEDGAPLPGANILEKGTSNGTQADFDGNFSIEVSGSDAVLVISYIGFTSQEIAVGVQTHFNISLEESASALDEVVLVGYGTQKKANVTGAVSTIKVDRLANMSLGAIDQKLGAQVAGVQVRQISGAPGSGAVVNIRGAGSIGAGDDPLYIVDGFPLVAGSDKSFNPLNTINPDDIESLTVLKDASSTAIYGSRGANGVVLITTKSAKNGKSSIEFTAYGGLQQVSQKFFPQMMNATEFAQFQLEKAQDFWVDEGNDLNTFDINTLDPIYRNPASNGEGVNWLKEITRVAPMQNYNLTITNGTKKVRSVISASYFNQEGTILGTDFERFSFRSNLETDLTDKIKVGLNIVPTLTKQNSRPTEGHNGNSLITQAFITPPFGPIYNPDGSYNPNIQVGGPFSDRVGGTFQFANPVNRLKNLVDETKGVSLLINAYVDAEIFEGLRFKTTFNVSHNNSNRDQYFPSAVGNYRDPAPSIPRGQFQKNTLNNFLNENTLSYTKSFNKHNIELLAGFSSQQERFERSTILASNYPLNDDIITPNAAATVESSELVDKWTLVSYFGRLNYNFDGRYLIGATIRRDGSSRFGENNRWGLFPSASLGWRVSEESFFPEDGFVSGLKLRASYGLTGNNSIGNYTAISSVITDDYVFGGVLAPGKRQSSLANVDLGWESSKQFNAGIDLELLKGRFFISPEIYVIDTEDMLQGIDIPASSGFSSIQENIGKVRNKGLELTLTGRILTGKLRWNSDFNISFNKNEVLDLGNKSEIIIGWPHKTITKTGQPLGLFYAYNFLGLYENQAQLDEASAPNSTIGTPRFEDVNGDGAINSSDFTVVGSPHADYNWAMTNTFNYGDFDFSFQLAGSQGGEVIDVYRRHTQLSVGFWNLEKDVATRYRPSNASFETNYGRVTSPYDFTNQDISSLFVQDASYVSIRNITLGYTLNTEYLKNFRLYFSAQNPFVFTKYKNGHPETAGFGETSSLQQGINYGGYPLPQIFTIGLNFKL
ncbi:hypothetical protein B4Q04_10830 [Zobellia sp. OII3]|uniref:SusC/RagA family TonB-linked outer membrane protein n=1 Tax=Zobellia sp. OII3 TaxID=2034520 RepID=UPI000B53677F|nr:TonB-dependent receptor [Zobellia sp. OII3]OWW25037.1 hypothetical protein B4Q04_10830 [Zobellia sp. OII3]